LALTANGWTYRKDIKGFMPELMETMYANRSKFKKQMLRVEQEAQEIEKEMRKRKMKF
jgi:DNA polymerase elongation subunit (family B)